MIGVPQILPLDSVPGMDPGVSAPFFFASERTVVLAYRTAQPEDGPWCVLEFEWPEAHYLGPPNDEALAGHPLYRFGLSYYAFAEVLNSPWITELCNRNRVHDKHSDDMFGRKRHFILTCHDSTAEVIAEAFSVSRTDDPLSECVRRLQLPEVCPVIP